MDEQKRAAELAVADALKTLESAAALLKGAKEANDEAKIASATSEVTKAQKALDEAKAALSAASSDDIVDILDDATGKKKALADGTLDTKDIKVPKDKFDDLSEKAKLFEQFGPVLAKLQAHPTLIDKLMAGDDPSQSVLERVKALEERETVLRRADITETITAATKTWPDFKTHWEGIKAMLPGLEATGLSYAESVQRAYFASNPEAAKKAERLVVLTHARTRENDRGVMRGGGGGAGPIVGDTADDEYPLTDADRAFAQAAGVDPKLYAKHRDHVVRFADL